MAIPAITNHGRQTIMSAFLCSDDHIRLLAIAAARLSECNSNEVEIRARENAKSLKGANLASLAARYPADDPHTAADEVVELDWWDSDRPELARHLRDPAAILKSVACFDYQACEYKGWATSVAKTRILPQAIAYAAKLIPGYEDAPWGIHDTDRKKPHNQIRLSDLCR